ncbi:MAG: sigma-54-dependent Fis family transcriptional regulator [Candidatus Eisenbacteria bacterium]|nr:sigma-54-dependent Fis family transcriptional regulator [Candidatus Eisenbacteria bacterium]
MTGKILIVDDEKNIRRTLDMILRPEGFETVEAASGEEAIRLFGEGGADLVVLDVKLPGMDGIETLREIRRAEPEQMVIMISGHATVATAVEATREGAFDFLEKPLTKERVLVAVRNALRFGTIGREVRELKAREAGRHVMLGDSPAMRRVRAEIERSAPTTARILIRGESGTGKELAARAVHESSPRRGRPFVKVNCAAIPEELIESELFGAMKGAYTGAVSSREGKFQQADGGTLFLDEVADMSLRAQAKVLRVLQEGEIEKVGGGGVIKVNVRVIAATNKNLDTEVAEGRFREDLFFRLNVVPIEVPPLRERREDIPKLTAHFLERYRIENNQPPRAISEEAQVVLDRLPWPGNVRELNNVVERLVIMSRGPEIGLADLRAAGILADSAPGDEAPAERGISAAPPGEILRLGGLVEARRRFEAVCIREALSESKGNVSEAARLLRIDRTNLHKKIQAYRIEAERDGSIREE